jgi:hypothetical protein
VTTVAASLVHKEIAADSMCSGEGGYYSVCKLRHWKDGVAGAAGDWVQILKFFNSIENGGDLDSDCDVECMELRAEGIYVYESTLIPARIKEPFYAIGTGSAYAIAAMHLGKSPREAVEIAALFDPATRGPIDVITIGGKRNGAKKNT